MKDRHLLSLNENNPEEDDVEGTVEENTTDNEREVKNDQKEKWKPDIYSQIVTELAVPTNISCLKPAVTQFPNPIIDKESRQQGLVILHILVAVYMFIGLAIVCDDFFVPSLTRVSDGG